MNNYNAISYLIGGLGIFALFLVFFALAIYVVYAIGVKKVLTYYGHPNTWMAFIPIVNTIALAQCVKADKDGNVWIFGKAIEKKWFIWFPVLQLVAGYVPVVGYVLSLAIGIIGLAHTYKDLLNRASENNEDNTVIAWISSIIAIVWLVMCYTRFKGTAKVEEVVVDEPTVE